MKIVDWMKRTNFLYKLLAVIVSIVLWFYVMGVTNPTVTRTFYDIKVNLTGKELLYNNYGYTVIDGDKSTVIVTLVGSRSDMLRVKPENISVEADMSSIKSTGPSSVVCRVIPPDSALRVQNSNNVRINVTADKIVEKQVPVKLQYNGVTPDGYMLGTTSVSPESILVRGAQTEVDDIAYALVNVTRDSFDKSYYEDASYVFVDQEKNEIKLHYTTSVTEKVKVSIPVLTIKDVPFGIHLEEGGGLTPGNVEISITPSVLKVAGDDAAVSSMDTIWLDTIDLSSLSSSVTSAKDITLPEGIVNIANIKSAEIKLSLVGVASKNIVMDSFQTINPPAGTVATTQEQQLSIELWGDAKIVSAIQKSDITVTADLSRITEPGSYVIPAQITINQSKTQPRIVGSYSLHITVEKEKKPK